MEGYMGTITPTAIIYPPRNWTDCNGQQLTIQQYSALYALIGVTYGGDARTVFNLPNLQGRSMLGQGTTPGTTQRFTLGQTGGASSVTLGANNLPPHIHPASATAAVSMSGMSVTLPSFGATANTTTTLQASTNSATQATPTAGNYLGVAQSKVGMGYGLASVYATAAGTTVPLAGVNSSTDVTVTPSSTATVTGTPSATVSVAVGANPSSLAPINTLPPYTAVRFIICTSGLFPARN